MPITYSFKSPELQAHDPQALNYINEIGQFTSDVRHKEGKLCVVPDLLSRPSNVPIGKSYELENEIAVVTNSPEYIAPEKTMSVLEEVALHTLNPSQIAVEQTKCQVVQAHIAGSLPKNVNI